MQVKFEFVGEDADYPGSKVYNIKAITVTTTRNDRKYKENELTLGARSLSFRPLNRNHESSQTLAYPANQTLVMDYNLEQMAVTGKMRIADPAIIELIDSGKINKLSIEQIPYKGESCSTQTGVCEQNGIIFTGMALLDYDVMPGDKNTEIRAESVKDIPIYEMVDLVPCSCCSAEGKELGPKAAARPDSDFAYVPKGGNPSDRKFPIYDAAHVRNALARFTQADLPASAKSAVKARINKAAKKFGIQVSEGSEMEAFAGYDDMDMCVDLNQDKSDPYGHCNILKGNSEKFKNADWPIIEKKDTKLTMDHIGSTFDSMNDSQIAHIVDPNNYYKNTKKFSQKKWKDLTPDQQTAMVKTYGFRHTYDDIKHLVPNEDKPQDTIFDDDLLGQDKDKDEKQIADATKKLQDAGIHDQTAQSMANQDPNNKTENKEKSSLNSEPTQEPHMTTGQANQDIKSKNHGKEWIESLRSMMLNTKWTTDKLEKFTKIMKSGEKKTEVDSMITAFIGMQNDKAPLSDKLADVLYNASDDELDQYARVTMDQEPSVITAGGLADYKAFTQEFMKSAGEMLVSSNQKLIAEFGEKLLAAAKTKTESVTTPSSQVDDSQMQAKKEAAKKMYEFYDIKNHPEFATGVPFKYVLDKNEFIYKLGGTIKSGAMDLSDSTVKRYNQESKQEAVTVTAGDMGQVFAKQVMLLPGGRMRVPVRQYCNFTEIPNGADRANWYTIGAFDFGAVTEGTEPSNVSQTVTKIQALPALRGAVQRVGYSQVENAPFGLVDSINNAMVLAGLADEANLLLSSTGAYWTSPSAVTNWVNGNSGASITNQNDDIASMTLSRTGLIAAKRTIAAGGYDTSPGNLVLFCHPKAYQDLMLDTNLNTYYQYARPDITATYVLEQLYGIDIVPTTAVAAATNTTNKTYRNVLAVKGWALGVAAAREITIEVQRRNEVQQLIISGMHRVQAAVIDFAASCGISSAQ